MGWDINMTPKRPPEWWLRTFTPKETPPKKPRARQLPDGSWWIRPGDVNKCESAVARTLPEAWRYWEQLCRRSASQ